MKKLVSRMDGISLRGLLSHFSILLVPLCVIAIIYSSTMSAVLAYRSESLERELAETSRILSARLQEVSNISLYIQSSTAVNAVINRSKSEGSRSIYAIHEAITALPSYQLANQLLRDVFIFFYDAQFVIKHPNAFGLGRYAYDQNIHFSGISYDEMIAFCRRPFSGELLVRAGDAGREALILRSIPSATQPQALIAIALDTQVIDDLMRANDVGPGGRAYIITETGEILSDTTGVPFDRAEMLALAREEGASYREITYGGRPYLLCQVSEGGLHYLTLTQKDTLLLSIAPVRYLLGALSLAAVVFGSLICIALWRQRQRMVKSIRDTAHGIGLDVRPAKSEAHLLEYTVSTLASAVGTLRERINLQHDALRQAVVQRCLTGAFENREEMMREVSALQLKLLAPCYHVVRVSLLCPWDAPAENAQVLPYRMLLKQFFAEHLPVPHAMADLDGESFALLLMGPEGASPDALKQLFRSLSSEMEGLDWEVPSFAISEGCDDLWAVSGLLAHTGEMLAYMTLLELRGVFCQADLPAGHDAMYFPMEVEIRLAQTMKSGTVEQFEAQFDEIVGKNITGRTLDAKRLSELFEALRRSVVRTLKEVGEQAAPDASVEALSAVRSFLGLRRYATQAKERMARVTVVQTREENNKMKETIREMIDELIPDPLLTLAMLAEQLGLSEGALYRAFKDLFGVSFSSYVEQRRIHTAFELLKGQVMIKDVAERVGYTSDQTFRRAFKRIMKVPPSQFAALIKE